MSVCRTQALERVLECIDHADPNYRNQLILVDLDVAHHLLEFLNDDSEAVQVKSASVIAALTDHCASSKVRLHCGVTALENQSCNILFNPVQDYFIKALPVLVQWTMDFRIIKADTALETISNITSFNKTAKIVLIECLCELIGSGNCEVIELLDRTVAAVDTIDENLLAILGPKCRFIMQKLSDKSIHAFDNIVTTLGFISTICERCPSIREEIVESHGAEIAFEFLLVESIPVRDAAVNTLWQMTLGQKHLIIEALRSMPEYLDDRFLEKSLQSIIAAGESSNLDADQDDLDSCHIDSVDVDYDEEAKKILDIVVDAKKRQSNEDLDGPSASCVLM